MYVHGVDIQSAIHLVSSPFYVRIVPLQRLLNRQKEDYVHEDDAVGTNEVEHLKGLCVADVGALGLVVHPLNEHVPPDVQCEEPRQQKETVCGPDPEVDAARLDLEHGVRQDLQHVEAQEGQHQPRLNRTGTRSRVAVVVAEDCEEKYE